VVEELLKLYQTFSEIIIPVVPIKNEVIELVEV